MKKLIISLFFLTSCSFNNNSAYLNEETNSNYEELNYEKDYTFSEYGKILKHYSDNNNIPRLN
tara:strand:+ start:406 stop:594 length:189 start_codon:yes stop_codon:yes gene_type:complete